MNGTKRSSAGIFILCMTLLLVLFPGTVSAQAAQEESGLSWVKAPGQMVLGLYDWDGDLLVYYYTGTRFGLCRMDAETREILVRLEGFKQELYLELCPDNLPKEGRIGRSDALFDTFTSPFEEDESEESGLWRFFREPSQEEEEPENLLRLYDSEKGCFQWMDEDFNLIYEYDMEETVTSRPLMDPSNQYIYYVQNSGQVIQLDWQAGKSQVMEVGGPFAAAPYLEGIYNEGTILSVSGMVRESDPDREYDNYVNYKNYIRVSDQQILKVSTIFSALYGSGSGYYTTLYGPLNQAVLGDFSDPEKRWEFIFPDYEEYDSVFAWTNARRLMTCYTDEGISASSHAVFSLYNMDTGAMEAQTRLELGSKENNLRLTVAGYLSGTQTGVFSVSTRPDRIYMWDTKASGVALDQSYKVPYMEADAADPQAFETLEETARTLEARFDVEIYLGDDCPRQLWGYKASPIYSVPKIRRALMYLETSLENYPEGFFTQLARPDGSRVRFYLVDSMSPDGEDSISSSVGLFGGSDGNYIALAVDSPRDMQTLVYHEVSHAIDYKLSGYMNQNYMDETWSDLNPPDFYYNWSYQANGADMSWDYVYSVFDQDQEIYFIDKYAKSFPTEDRARIMEYAMGMYPGSIYFSSPHVLEKLEYISRAIREGFDTQGWPKVTWWERPLAMPSDV